MAKDAYKKLQKKMDAATEAQIAEYIMRDIDLRQQNAEEQGVLAYGHRPIPRGRPNERFLKNTIRSVDYANRRAVEEELWDKWQSQKARNSKSQGGEQIAPVRRGKSQPERQHEAASSSGSDRSEDEVSSASTSGLDRANVNGEEELQELLSRRAVRGRGASGSRADEPGPFLPRTMAEDYPEPPGRSQPLGPQAPIWMQTRALPESVDIGPREPRPAALGVKAGKAGKKEKKPRKSKKEKKHKERKRKQKARRKERDDKKAAKS